MIITDLDNTLLTKDKNISEYSINVLKKCQAKGIKIVFATARSKGASSRILDQFMPDIFVGYGGALVMEGNKIIHRIDISVETSNKIIKECLDTKDVNAIYAINESIAITNDKDFLENQQDSSHYRYSDFTDIQNNSYLKISFITNNQNFMDYISNKYPMCDILRYTGENLYRIANKNAVKWNAIKAISEYYNIGTNTFIAFGDDVNDLEMIQKCGTGIAVKNAIKEVISVAKYICDTNENNGVAKWINENIL